MRVAGRQRPTTPGTTDAGLVNSVSIRWLFESCSLRVSRWQCRVERRGLTEERRQPWHIIAFPHLGAYRMHTPEGVTFVDANTVAFFNAGRPYQTSHPNGCGDQGSSLVVAPEVLGEALAAFDPDARDRIDAPFRRCGAASPPSVYLRLRLFLNRLQRGTAEDPLDLEETGLRLLETIVPLAAGACAPAASAPTRSTLDRVEEARILLERRFRDALSLADLATAVDLSPYHLCRMFRKASGLTVHRYLVRLRLREAVDRLADGAPDLSRVALATGFSSHSHFSAAFRQEFGVSPSHVRDAAASGSLRRLAPACADRSSAARS